ncbi:hypothetical protein [Nonomuraea wenchangensis]|uniref:hypothetical protein n=1 Tax=Nonomuraea wenchangensis TaxID=568860 RepID=UPI0033244C90
MSGEKMQTHLDSAICPPCGRAITVCRHSYLGHLSARAEFETWLLWIALTLGPAAAISFAETAAIAWHNLIRALVEAEGLTWKEAHAKAAAMIEEVQP